jgi:hypothetical protein
MSHTFHAVSMPDGSVMKSFGLLSESNPAISVEIPNGRTPGICVYLYIHRWPLVKIQACRQGLLGLDVVGTYLLKFSDESGNIFNGYWILNCKSMTLALNSSLFYKHTSICAETLCRQYSRFRARHSMFKATELNNLPAKARQTWSSSIQIFLTVRGS